jgi:hypothetical protein
LGSAVKTGGVSAFRKRRTRSTNSDTSSSAKALPIDSIGTRWRTLPNFSDGFAPTFCERLSGVASSGNCSSIAS